MSIRALSLASAAAMLACGLGGARLVSSPEPAQAARPAGPPAEAAAYPPAVPSVAQAADAPAGSPAGGFDHLVLPLLKEKCSPCHFEGGNMYGKLPFDQAGTIRTLGTRLFTRIKDEESQAKIRAFLEAR